MTAHNLTLIIYLRTPKRDHIHFDQFVEDRAIQRRASWPELILSLASCEIFGSDIDQEHEMPPLVLLPHCVSSYLMLYATTIFSVCLIASARILLYACISELPPCPRQYIYIQIFHLQHCCATDKPDPQSRIQRDYIRALFRWGQQFLSGRLTKKNWHIIVVSTSDSFALASFTLDDGGRTDKYQTVCRHLRPFRCSVHHAERSIPLNHTKHVFCND